MSLQVLLYKPSDFNDAFAFDEDHDDEDVDRVLTLETFADFRHLRLLDITFVDLLCDSHGPTWGLKLHPNFAGSYRLPHINNLFAQPCLRHLRQLIRGC